VKRKSGKTEEIKVRVPPALKQAVVALANARLSSESDIARQALLEYLERHKLGPRAKEVVRSPGESMRATLEKINKLAQQHHVKRVKSV
jgi:hypothetical protein